MAQLTEQEAITFFSEFYNGEHHIPGFKPKQYGLGYRVDHDRGDLATYDFTELTRLVLMAHKHCIRVGIESPKARVIRIAIWKRNRDGGMSERHPTIEEAIERFNQ